MVYFDAPSNSPNCEENKMPVRTSYSHGTPSWIDLSTTDPSAAQEFYSAMFGWEFEANPTDQGGDYYMATIDGKATAGMMKQQPAQAEMGMPSMWNSYVTVDDLDAVLAKVEPAGGMIHMPAMKVMDSGHMAVIADPTGAAICLWQAADHIGAELINEHGTLTWNECQTTDIDAATKFYGELFGWVAEEVDMGPDGTYTVFNLAADAIAGASLPPMPGVPPHWGAIFAVDDCDAAVKTATERGGTIIVEPFEMMVGRYAVIADPQGAVFNVLEPTEQPAD